jgi:hypothetical protein
MRVRYGNGDGLLGPSKGRRYVKAEVVFDIQALVGSDVEIRNERVRNS